MNEALCVGGHSNWTLLFQAAKEVEVLGHQLLREASVAAHLGSIRARSDAEFCSKLTDSFRKRTSLSCDGTVAR